VAEFCGLGSRIAANNRWCFSGQRLMNPIPVVVLSELHKFLLKILGVPKKQVVKVFATYRPDQPLNGGM